MQQFVQLYQTLDQTTSTNAKVLAMADYFSRAKAEDAAWAVYFLSGRRLKRLVGSALMRQWLSETCDLPNWLIDECYARVGDLAETIALLVPEGQQAARQISLHEWVEQKILPLRNMEVEDQQKIITHWWRSLSYEECYLVVKLLTGALRVGVSQLLLAKAVAAYAELPRALIVHRLMGEWTPDADFWQMLVSKDTGEVVASRPYPFCLASPLEESVESLGSIDDWQIEWKWDGIRAQLIRRQGSIYLWSRGEELITERYPEIMAAASDLPDGTVLDGEILAWNSDGVLPFSSLQKRIGRKKAGKKLLQTYPCRFLAYDLMEFQGQDIRDTDLSVRRSHLEHITGSVKIATENKSHLPTIGSSEIIKAADWPQLVERKKESRQKRVEGMMLKHRQAKYHPGRKRGHWWKWKVDPYTIDAILIYAQAGHGRRSNLFTDYTFAVWAEGDLVPVAKAYSGLDNSEIAKLDKWVRKNTVEKFGPVRSVPPLHVFELAFEGISESTRHKSGVAVRFPRILRWREDLTPKDADSIEDMKRLMQVEQPRAQGESL